jgi:hypothetical protein
MSDYGADKKPDLNKAKILAWDNGFLPQRKANVMQWSYEDNIVVRKLANKSDGSNCLFKIQE